MPPDTSTRPGSSGARTLLWMQGLLIGVGVCLLVWVGLLTADARIAQRLARESLRTVPRAAAVSTTVDARPLVLARGAAIGELTIPRVHLSAMVLHGSDSRTLRRGPGHIERTALPGQPGNVAVAGHRDTFFRPIRDVRVGDDIYFDTAEGRFHYRVSSLDVVGPNAVSVLDTTDVPTLTLVTCYPFWLAGPAPDRYVVRASEVDRQDNAPALTRATVASDIAEIGSRTTQAAPLRQLPYGIGQTAVEQPAARPRPDEPANVAVRRAIEQFRITYNLRLTRRPEESLTPPLALGSCDIVAEGTSAVATCVDLSTQAPEGQQWIFSLRAGNGTWNISAVEPR